MPFPVHDSLPCMKVSGEKTEIVMKRIQDLIYRNSQPKKTSSGQQAFRLQQVSVNLGFFFCVVTLLSYRALLCIYAIVLSFKTFRIVVGISSKFSSADSG